MINLLYRLVFGANLTGESYLGCSYGKSTAMLPLSACFNIIDCSVTLARARVSTHVGTALVFARASALESILYRGSLALMVVMQRVLSFTSSHSPF